MVRIASWLVLVSLGFGVAVPALPAKSLAQASDPIPERVDPLDLIPDHVGVVLKAERPGKLIDLANQVYALKELQGIRAYRDFLDSTNVRRFLQIVSHFEKQLGKDWPHLVDALMGQGVAVGVEFKQNPTPVYGVIQGKDAELTQKFVPQLWEIIEQELARQENKSAAKTDKYRGVVTYQVGEEFFAASFGATIAFSNLRDSLHTAIDLSLGKGKTPPLSRNKHIAEAVKLFDGEPLAWGWLNLEAARKNEMFASLLELPAGADVAALHFLFGGLLDIIKRSPYLAVGLTVDGKDPVLSIRAPRGHDGRYDGIEAHVPPLDEPNCAPLLEPKHCLVSGSFYFDFNALWEQRAKLLKADDLTGFEEFDKNTAQFLFGRKMSQVFSYAGTRHRFVAVRQVESGYKTKPGAVLPSFALLFELRDPDNFMKAMDPFLRSVALLGGFAAETKLVEEKIDDVKVVGYRFAESEKNKAIQQGILFNFSPCYFRIDDQFVACSTFELAEELIPLIKKQNGVKHPKDTASSRVRFSWAGLGDYFDTIRDQLVTGQILADGSTPEQAKKEVEALLTLLRNLGTIEMSSEYEKDRFRIDFRVKGLFK